MCKFWSCIITRDGRVHASRDDSSHETIITRLKLKDDKLEDRDFVRIEVVPSDVLNHPRDQAYWELRVDEEGTLPAWYTSQRKKHEATIWSAWKSAMKETLWKLRLEEAAKIVAELKNIPYFKPQGDPDPEWVMHWGKTWDAAGEAVWDAARVAVGAAAGDAALYCRFLMLPESALASPELAKHYMHAKKRMEVWRRGYALFCDVDGKLYVYSVKPKAADYEE